MGKFTAAPPLPLVNALRRLLRPLVRLLLSHGITYPYLAELLKSIFVDVAADDFRIDQQPSTDSRISLLSGVHRKDVKRLRQQTPANDAPPATVSLGAELIARWSSTPAYLDKQGKPRPLARLANDGGTRSFEALVQSVSKDIRSRVVLDEWLRLGVAHVDADDCVCLNVDAFVPKHGFEEKAYYFGQNIADHMAACVHNLLDAQPPLLERSVYYDQLTPKSIEQLDLLARELGMQALQTINKKAIELSQRDAGNVDAIQRMNFGIYYFSAPVLTEPDKDDHGKN
ncbi:MAG: hypothetical protein HY308_03810 [Gammaproteobacteria bacterium]|nr:hypothetical protein [Gammaproteobacteria bacterium]